MTSFTNTTMPICSSCVPQANGCCTFRTDLCIPPEPQTLDELLLIDPLAQMLFVICSHTFLWNPCSGPFGSGITAEALTLELQDQFPDYLWTDTIVPQYLAVGVQQGLMKVLDGAYYVNQNLLNINPRNWRYEIVCAQLCPKKACKPATRLYNSFA